MQTWNAKLYDDKHAFVWRHGASVVELLAPKKGERVLDLGCGTGHLTAQIAAAGCDVVGIDHSAEMIAEAQKTHSALRFETADARDFAASSTLDGPFDAVFSNAVLHWVRPPEAVVRNVWQVLKPRGRFVAEFGGHGNIAQIQSALKRITPEFNAAEALPDWYYPTIAEYSSLLEREGLEPTFAALFDRPTPLAGPQGLRDWVTMFARAVVERIDAARREEFFVQLEESLRPTLLHDGVWTADYRRLRVVAVCRPGRDGPVI